MVLNLVFSPNIIQSISVKPSQYNQHLLKSASVDAVKSVNRKIVKDITGLSEEEWNKAFNETLEFIKKHEGWNKGVAYLDAGGIKTIGYGHVVLATDILPDTITQVQADSILVSDFNKALRACDRVTNLKGYKRLAISHFIFAKGIGSYLRSELRQKVIEGSDISEEILEWCTYRDRKGRRIHSDYSLNIRKWELQMYYR